eukprot:TRINITY_DN24722_c0_g1_i1.p1 TRINITY_DN24722_c0_g1~~TRINITY_DN24722_c0_g1_i1.p1  ORF type:complete len:605 (+),score=70.14 TRINITY_DN24722_c0_g1_i1:95-1909(+)
MAFPPTPSMISVGGRFLVDGRRWPGAGVGSFDVAPTPSSPFPASLHPCEGSPSRVSRDGLGAFGLAVDKGGAHGDCETSSAALVEGSRSNAAVSVSFSSGTANPWHWPAQGPCGSPSARHTSPSVMSPARAAGARQRPAVGIAGGNGERLRGSPSPFGRASPPGGRVVRSPHSDGYLGAPCSSSNCMTDSLTALGAAERLDRLEEQFRLKDREARELRGVIAMKDNVIRNLGAQLGEAEAAVRVVNMKDEIIRGLGVELEEARARMTTVSAKAEADVAVQLQPRGSLEHHVSERPLAEMPPSSCDVANPPPFLARSSTSPGAIGVAKSHVERRPPRDVSAFSAARSDHLLAQLRAELSETRLRLAESGAELALAQSELEQSRVHDRSQSARQSPLLTEDSTSRDPTTRSGASVATAVVSPSMKLGGAHGRLGSIADAQSASNNVGIVGACSTESLSDTSLTWKVDERLSELPKQAFTVLPVGGSEDSDEQCIYTAFLGDVVDERIAEFTNGRRCKVLFTRLECGGGYYLYGRLQVRCLCSNDCEAGLVVTLFDQDWRAMHEGNHTAVPLKEFVRRHEESEHAHFETVFESLESANRQPSLQGTT